MVSKIQHFTALFPVSTKDSRSHTQKSYRGKPSTRCLDTKVQAFFVIEERASGRRLKKRLKYQ